MTEIKQKAESPQAVTASPAEPAHVERVTEKKVKNTKKWRPGVKALPPGKSDCSNTFKQPRNHYVHQSAQLTTTARLLLQRKRSCQNAKTNGQNITGSNGSYGLGWRGVHLRMSLRAKTCACAPVPSRWRQASRPKSRINLPN